MKEITKEFCIVRIKRTTEGLAIYCKSQKLEEFWRRLSEHQNAGIGEGREGSATAGLKYYKINNFPSLPFRVASWGEEGALWYNNTTANLSFIRTVGLSEGITYCIRGVFSLESIQKWIEETKVHLQKFYTQYLKPVDIEFVISTREEI